MTDISTIEFLEELNKHIDIKGGYEKAAKHFDVSESFLRSVVNCTHLPGTKILNKMKLKPLKTINYRYEKLKGFRYGKRGRL